MPVTAIVPAAAITKMQDLASRLAQRLSALAQTQSFDSAGNPCLLLGTGTATQENFFIRILPVAATWALDVIGSPANVYTPFIAQIAVEAVSGAGAQPVPPGDLLTVQGLLAATGMEVQIWNEATGTAPSLTTFNTASKQKGGTFVIEPKYAGMSGTSL
jgi:hypothetical protein